MGKHLHSGCSSEQGLLLGLKTHNQTGRKERVGTELSWQTQLYNVQDSGDQIAHRYNLPESPQYPKVCKIWQYH